ncbi:MAG: 3-deoxy-D-manno-octulosonic acid transferase [Ferruginibacter sp.]|nr:3-deoxy-D-manno-octulosonic acid transferase [Cytophagales bacterium]
MALLLYTLSVRLYGLLLRLVSPFHPKARQWTRGRQSLFDGLESAFSGNAAPVAWFHCASLGEFEQGRPVIESYRKRYPNHHILLTFFSPSGYAVRKNYPVADHVTYLPLDTARHADRFVALVKPRIAFFVKYEFWYYHLRALHRQRIPVLSVSAIFRPEQLFFRPYGGFYRRLLTFFDHLFVQNEASRQLLIRIGIAPVTVAGDTRFDRVRQVYEARKAVPLAERFKDGRKLLVIGSSWPADTAVLVPFLNRFESPLKIIIAPHEIHGHDLDALQKSLTGQSVRYSQAEEATVAGADVLIIDNVGMLASLYQYGEFAYVGGGFGKGLHNILEAATFGMPLFFGPNHQRFQEATDLIEAGAARPIQQTADFENAFVPLYTNDAERFRQAELTRRYVAERTGATAAVMRWVEGRMESQ